jgi:hypothetical protein
MRVPHLCRLFSWVADSIQSCDSYTELAKECARACPMTSAAVPRVPARRANGIRIRPAPYAAIVARRPGNSAP